METANSKTIHSTFDFSDYQQMYDLNSQDLSKTILDFHGDTICLNTMATQPDVHVTCADVAALPALPYKTHQFDLALCPDVIFDQSNEAAAMTTRIRELCRVAQEVRIFPLMDRCGKMRDEFGLLMLFLQKNHFGVEVREVPYKTSQGSSAMLRIWSQTCTV